MGQPTRVKANRKKPSGSTKPPKIKSMTEKEQIAPVKNLFGNTNLSNRTAK